MDNQLIADSTGVSKLAEIRRGVVADLLSGRVRVPADIDKGGV